MSHPALPLRRVAATVAAVLLPLAVLAPVGARADDSLDAQAAAIVAQATSGTPLRVVVTRTSAAGVPSFRTTVASTAAEAVGLVRAALGQGLTVSMAQPASITATATDPYRSRQWAISQLRATSVWKISTGGATRSGNRQATVAVVDTGVSPHPDLGANRVSGGYDYVDPGTRADDENGHGTHVAGIIGALANNGRGISGLAPKVRILPIRVLDADGAGTTDDIARGVVRAVEKGAQVINISAAADRPDAALQQAVEYAQAHRVLVVAAAGNDGGPVCTGILIFTGCPVQYPAAYAGVLGVGSIDSDRDTSSFSTYGSWVDVVAPGGDIYSLAAPQAHIGDCAGRSYCYLSGTSMATPYVAAAAALGYSAKGWRGSTLAAKITGSATDRGAAGRDDHYGAGLLNPLAMLTGH